MIRRVLRPIFNKAASSLGILGVQERLDSVQQSLSNVQERQDALRHRLETDSAIYDLLERRIADFVQAAKADNENRIQSLNESLVAFVNAKQEQNVQLIASAELEMNKVLSEFRQSIDTIRRQVVAPSVVREVVESSTVVSSAPIIDDGLYVALENHFRGSRDIVADRQKEYLDLLPASISAETPLVDLGCGRGEWLQVLKDSGISAIGVDSNTVCVAECKEAGLSIIENDLLEYLVNQPDQSVGAVTMFQVLEHLPFPILVDVLRHVRRILVHGGLFIAEVPNAKNLRVASGTFWIDPTHQRPLFPELLLFLATEVGFGKSEGRYVNDLSPDHDLSGLPEGAKEALETVLYAVDGPADFALLATA